MPELVELNLYCCPVCDTVAAKGPAAILKPGETRRRMVCLVCDEERDFFPVCLTTVDHTLNPRFVTLK